MGIKHVGWGLAGVLLLSAGHSVWAGSVRARPVAIKITLVEVGTWDKAVAGVKRPGPGNTKSFKATVTPDTKAKIKFTLVGVSKEKGVNMNTGDSTAYDLTFENQEGFKNPEGDKIEIVEDNTNDGTATVSVTANDYGAFGKIKAEVVEAIQEDNMPLAASTSLSVLKDADDNNIEDAWDDANPGPGNNNSANRDNEEVPELDGTKGDWSSRYEEYRGFTINGTYEPTSILRKDWFYVDVDKIGQVGDMTNAINGDLVLHMLKMDEIGGKYEINFNRGHQNIHRQKATPITNSDETDGAWGLTGTTGGRLPDNVNYCRVWVDKFKRKIATSKAVTNAINFIPVTENSNSGDESIAWQVGGRISVEAEAIDYADYQAYEASTKLFAPATAASTVLLVEKITGSLSAADKFMVINDGEQVIAKDSFRIAKVESSKLTEEVNNAATILKVADPGNFNFSSLTNAYVVVDDEQMRLTAVSTSKKELTVVRGQNGTTAAAHANMADVYLPCSFSGVTRAKFGTTAAAHAAGESVEAPRCFFGCTRGATGTTAAAHASGKDVPYFFSAEQTNRAIAATFCHEACHTLGCSDLPREAKAIMNGILRPGSYDTVGLWHTHIPASIKQMRLRTP